MTAMPEKLSCEKSERSEKAAWRVSHFFVMYFPTMMPLASSSAMGMSASSVSPTSMRHIFTTVRMPKNAASHIIMMPEPKHSWMVSRSFVNRDMRFPTLLT